MFRITSRRCRKNSRSGFYIASHPWLRAEGILKVGFSTDLRQRLRMTNYVTCFSDEWRYEHVYLCKPWDARLLEYAVLNAMKDVRVPNRELLKTSVPLLATVVDIAAKALQISVVRRELPVFRLPGPKSTTPKSSKASPAVKQAYDYVHEEISRAVNALDRNVSTSTSQVAVLRAEPVDTPAVPSEARPAYNSDVEEEEEELRESLLDVSTGQNEPFTAVALRDYQEEAVARVWREMKSSGRAIIQMACRSGKTPVAHKLLVLTASVKPNGRFLFLVPGLSLLRQTACKFVAYGLPQAMQLLLVGSDPCEIHLPNGQTVSMTTEASIIGHALSNASVPVLIICTYASSCTLNDILLTNHQSVALTIFDEAHRVCGSSGPSAFNTMLLAPPSGDRIFLTATPTYDTPIRMDNVDLFGGIAFRFYLREGVKLGHINDFGVEIVLGDTRCMVPMISKALSSVNKLLVFCKNIRHAEELCEQTRLHRSTTHECFVAHSRLGPRSVAATLAQFRAAPKAVLFNVRLFQEGVEVPDLNAVFFAAPRYSPRDIIQSICRPLNVLDGKPPSTVFLPAHFDPSVDPSAPANLASFGTLVPYTDALMDEDPSLFEYLIDPSKHNYRIRVVGVRELKTSDQALQNVVLPSLRRGVRYSKMETDRLHRAERLPWKLAFAELRRVVTECNRYPKINDAWVIGDARVSLHSFYKYCRQGYLAILSGDRSCLQQYQVRDLESLPHWTTYGIHGPYPWKECLETLRRYVEKHQTFPLLDIHRGGYIGLEATPFERLAGALCNINQQERQEYLAVSPEKQRDLDQLCAAHGLTWRKPRKANGTLCAGATSLITDCYDEFKRRFERNDPTFAAYVAQHFPGYPKKHKYMESLAVQRAGVAPPRLKVRSEAQLKRMEKRGSSDKRERVVVCRQCRIEVHASEWQQHITSAGHLANVA